MIDNHASYNKQLFGARYATYEAGQPCECPFSVLLLFLLLPLQPLLNPTSITTCTWILCSRVILINTPVGSTILAGFFVYGGRYCEIVKLAITVLKYII